MFGANCSHGVSLDPLREHVYGDNQVGKAQDTVLKGPKRSEPHNTKGHVMGMVWSFWVDVWTCLAK
jgi:hypothetical protein